MHPDRPCYGIPAPAYTEADSNLTVELMAANYLETIQTFLSPNGTAVFAGFSLGGAIAYEMARQHFEASGCALPTLMIDNDACVPRSRLQLVRDAVRNLPDWLRYRALRATPLALVQRALRRIYGVVLPNTPLPEIGFWCTVLGQPIQNAKKWQVMLMAARYEVQPYSGPVVILCAANRGLFDTREYALGWATYAKNLRSDYVPGTHGTWMSGVNLASSVEVIRRYLNSME